MEWIRRNGGEINMIIIGAIWIVGVIFSFILWCCVKVGKESDIEYENHLKAEGQDFNQEDMEREEEG